MAAAFVVPTRTADRPHGPGHVFAPQRTAPRVGKWVREEVHGRVPQKPGTQYYAMDDESVPGLSGTRPAALQEPRPQGEVVRHCGSGYELVLDATVLQLEREEVEAPMINVLRRVIDLLEAERATSSRNKIRKKTKRRKKELPKTSSSSFFRRGGAGDQGILHGYAEVEAKVVGTIEYVRRADVTIDLMNVHSDVISTQQAEPVQSVHSKKVTGYSQFRVDTACVICSTRCARCLPHPSL